MINMVQKAKDDITGVIKAALDSAIDAGDLPLVQCNTGIFLEKPKDKLHGDFACTFCMQAAREFSMPPRKLAEILTARFDLSHSYADSFNIAGPGFINFKLSRRWLCDSLRAIFDDPSSYGRSDYGQGRKIMVEYVSANPTGPMHMGNARGGALGDCLASVLDAAGFDVTREFYVNDAGNQIEKFFQSLKARYIMALRGDDAYEFPEDGYHGDDITQLAAEFITQYGDCFLNSSDDDLRGAIVPFALHKNIDKMKSDLHSYRITHDVWFLESTLHDSGAVSDVIDKLTASGHTYQKDGALWLRCGDDSDKDEVLVRANGVPTYFAADIAYHKNKLVDRGFDVAIDIWGADHHGHVARMKSALDALGVDGSRLHVVLMQLVRLMRGGEAVRMSKRTGKSITLRDLLDETSTDAARFFFNMRQANSHLDFDLDLAVEQSSQNPVFYVQYAHARICSMLKFLREDGFEPRDANHVDFSLLDKSEEIDLITHLVTLPEEVIESARSYEPSRLTRYVVELAALFHRFYNAHRVKADDTELLYARLALVQAVSIVIRTVLDMLKITAPEEM